MATYARHEDTIFDVIAGRPTPREAPLDLTETSPLRQLRDIIEAAYQLTVIASPDVARRGTTVPLETTMFVGRTGDLAIRDRRMSKVHLKLGRSQRGMWTAQDAGSKNGVCVNGRVVAATHVLSDGDVLRAGDTVFLFERQFAPMSPPSGSVGRSAASASLFEWIERRGSSNLHLMITGESGVGKDVAARALHEFSGRRGKFVPVNAGAIPPALREAHLFGHVRGAFTGAVDERAGFV
ncbi:MAG: pSer/pThr/pTyr-binding forkhead associated (FHA) protein, partial [Myxococcota bacterium]